MSSLITKLRELESKLDIIDDSWITVREYIHSTYPNLTSHRVTDNHYSMWAQRLFHIRTPWSNWLKRVNLSENRLTLLIDYDRYKAYMDYMELLYMSLQKYYYIATSKYPTETESIRNLYEKYPELQYCTLEAHMSRVNRWFRYPERLVRDISKDQVFLNVFIKEFGDMEL